MDEKRILNQSKEERELNSVIECFYADKQQADKYKKSADKYNKEIKDTMDNMNIKEFEGDNLVAKITVQKRESFNDAKLLEILEKYKEKIPGLIVMQPTVDMDKLEDAIYNELINASELQPSRQIKEVVTLKVTERK